MKVKKELFIGLALLGAAIVFPLRLPVDTSFASDSSKLHIIYGNDVEGYLETCG